MKNRTTIVSAAGLTLAAALLAPALVTSPVSALAPQDDTTSVESTADLFKRLDGELRQRRRAPQAETAAWLDEQLAGVDPSTFDDEMLAGTVGIYARSGEARERMATVLADRAKADDLSGVESAMLSMQLARDEESRSQVVDMVLAHPAWPKALDAGKTDYFLYMAQRTAKPALKAHRDDLMRAMTVLEKSPSKKIGRDVQQLAMALADDSMGLDQAERDRVLDRAVAVLDRVLPKMDEGREREYLTGQRARLDGPAMRGTLMDNVAPAITWKWTSDKTMGADLAALKGKVVVIDFWATWCGPCVASFPKVRELVQHYAGHDVVVLGVTSVQGRHYGTNGVVDCTDDPQKEFSLMPEYMSEKEITWPIVFSDFDVFDPRFGVNGIPHVAILDTQGRVRHNGLHPASPLEKKTEMIDALLAEAGKSTPDTPTDG